MEKLVDRRRHVYGVLLAGFLATGCGDGDCGAEIETAEAFLSDPANLVCETHENCVVVGTGCHTVAGGTCQQAQLSRTASASQEWATISSKLQKCESGPCDHCGAALLATCAEGFCGGPR